MVAAQLPWTKRRVHIINNGNRTMREHYSTSNTTGHWKRGLTGYGLSETAKGQCIKSSANRGHGASLIMDVGFFLLDTQVVWFNEIRHATLNRPTSCNFASLNTSSNLIQGFNWGQLLRLKCGLNTQDQPQARACRVQSVQRVIGHTT
jgi:hypothetical protein